MRALARLDRQMTLGGAALSRSEAWAGSHSALGYKSLIKFEDEANQETMALH